MRRFALVFGLFLIGFAGAARAEPQWLTLPPTPSLPAPAKTGYAPVNGIKIWYATFGHGPPVILLHGGLANADYWGKLVPVLAAHYRVVVMDSRGHGRSFRDARPYGYDLMAADVLALMDFLKIDKAALVGWSDGAIIGLDIAIHHPERLTKLFAFAANSDPSGVKDVDKSSGFHRLHRAGEKGIREAVADADAIRCVSRPDHQNVGDTAALDSRRSGRHQGADLDRRCGSRRGDRAGQYPVHGRSPP